MYIHVCKKIEEIEGGVSGRDSTEKEKKERREGGNERFAHRLAAPVNLIIGTRCHCSIFLRATRILERESVKRRRKEGRPVDLV